MAQPSTVIAVKKFFEMSTKEMQTEYSPLSPQDKADFSNMLPAVGVETKDNAKFNAAAKAAAN